MIFDYPYTDMHELNLDWFLAKFKELVENWNNVESEWNSLHDYVQNYFENLNVQTEIDNKINAMILDGTFADIVSPFVTAALPALVAGQLPDVVAAQISSVVAAQISAVVADQLPAVAAAAAAAEVGDWLAAHIDPDTGYVIDKSLTVSDAAADAKVVGIDINKVGQHTENLVNDQTFVHKWYYESGGTWNTYTSNQYGMTIPMQVTTGHAYILSSVIAIQSAYKLVWLDENEDVISRVDSYYFDYTDNKTFLLIAPATARYAVIQVNKGSAMTLDDFIGYHLYFAEFGYNTYMPNLTGDDKIKSLMPTEYTSYELYNDNQPAIYGFINSDGTFRNSYGKSSTLYIIPVEALETYYIYYDGSLTADQISYYDADFNFISRNNQYPAKTSFISDAPADAVFALVGLYNSDIIDMDDEVKKHNVIIRNVKDMAKGSTPYHGTFIDANAEHYNGYKGKIISLLGDSITTYAGPDSTPAGHAGHMTSDGKYTYAGNCCRYPLGDVDNVYKTYWMMFADRMGFNIGINDSWAGSYITWNGTEGDDVGADKYIASQTRIDHLGGNGSPDYILVNAGTNDINSNITIGTFNTDSPINYTDEEIATLPVATFADGLRALLIRLQKTYPMAKIIFMLPNYVGATFATPKETDDHLEMIKTACDFFGVPWIDMRTSGMTMFNVSSYTEDNVHPNYDGMKELADLLMKQVRSKVTE